MVSTMFIFAFLLNNEQLETIHKAQRHKVCVLRVSNRMYYRAK